MIENTQLSITPDKTTTKNNNTGDGVGSFLSVGQWNGETLQEEGFIWGATAQFVYLVGAVLPLETPAGTFLLLSIIVSVINLSP